jgi:hypothetical protein
VATRFTRAEEQLLVKAATYADMNLREWARTTLLAAARQTAGVQDGALFIEIQSLRLLLINTLEPLLRGERMSSEQFKEMLHYVRANKRNAAADMLASYAESKEDQL